MPYIPQSDRGNYNGYIRAISIMLKKIDKNIQKGHLNYIITKLLLDTNPQNYSDFNDLIGVLECAKLEMYGHKIRPYEDIKIMENGEI